MSPRFASLAAFAVLSPVAGASTIHVPADFPTIQQAISDPNTKDGDEVLVGPGSYVENIDFLGKAIRVASTDGPRVTIIDGNRSNHVVYFGNGEDRNSTIEGFSIVNGSAGNDGGGGIKVWTDATSTCSPTIVGNIIAVNSANGGGGILLSGYTNPLITNNIISANDSTGHQGGGIYVGDYSAAVIANNMIITNVANKGGAIYLNSSAGTVTIVNNTIAANSSGDNAIQVEGGVANISNTIIWSNASGAIGGNASVSFSDIQGGHSGTGNISSDPLFQDTANGDYHILRMSPCRNAGNNGDPNSGIQDVDNEPRIDALTGIVDIGADEGRFPEMSRYRGVSLIDPVLYLVDPPYCPSGASDSHSWSMTDPTQIRDDLDTIRFVWGANILRLPVFPSDWENVDTSHDVHLDLLKLILDEAEKRDLAVIIDWHGFGNLSIKNICYSGCYDYRTCSDFGLGNRPDLASTIAFWKVIANEFKTRGDMLYYEIFNEPTDAWGSLTWADVRTNATAAIDAIRAIDPNRTVLVGGTAWASDLSQAVSFPIPRSNVVYVSHPYPGTCGSDPTKYEACWDYLFGDAARQFPVFVTEWGFDPSDKDPYDGDTATYGDPITRYFESRGIGWTAWCFSASWGPKLLQDWNGPTPSSEFGAFTNGTLVDWTSLKYTLAGTRGAPSLMGAGQLVGNDPVGLGLTNALENSLGFLIIGFSPIYQPLFGGVLVPAIDVPPIPVFIDSQGSLDLTSLWPSGIPSQFEVYFQYWIVDPNAPRGLSASNGLRLRTP